LRHLRAERKTDGRRHADQARGRALHLTRIDALTVAWDGIDLRASGHKCAAHDIHRRVFDRHAVTGIDEYARSQAQRAFQARYGQNLIGVTYRSTGVPQIGCNALLKTGTSRRVVRPVLNHGRSAEKLIGETTAKLCSRIEDGV